jgi:acetylornithine deacetylase/succinyl-diaminopimelate desuccinylase-like protein
VALNEHTVHQRIDERAGEFLDWLVRLASIPSISATGEGIRECASELVSLMQSLGVESTILETGGQPLVWGTVGKGSPSLVVYGHYDVQPAGPAEAWRDPPFSPTVREEAIWGRGVGDNKGQLLAHLCALSAWLDIHGEPPPFRLVFAFDGEEEIGSPASSRFIATHPEYFSGDVLYGADGSSLEVWEPALFLGTRGLLYLELRIECGVAEWHSGSYGGLLPNPVHRLAQALLTLVDRHGKVLVRGFYDDVVPPSPLERELAAKLPTSFLAHPAHFGRTSFLTESPRDSMFFTPQFCLCGFNGGYEGEGVKTAVPTRARAKIDATLLPNQDPQTIADCISAHLVEHGFDDVQLEVLAACPPISIAFDHPLVQTSIRALESVWNRPPVIFPSIGGGGPLAAFALSHGMPCLMVPYAQADLHEHSTEEHFSLTWFVNGIKTSAELFRLIASGDGRRLGA